MRSEYDSCCKIIEWVVQVINDFNVWQFLLDAWTSSFYLSVLLATFLLGPYLILDSISITLHWLGINLFQYFELLHSCCHFYWYDWNHIDVNHLLWNLLCYDTLMRVWYHTFAQGRYLTIMGVARAWQTRVVATLSHEANFPKEYKMYWVLSYYFYSFSFPSV